ICVTLFWSYPIARAPGRPAGCHQSGRILLLDPSRLRVRGQAQHSAAVRLRGIDPVRRYPAVRVVGELLPSRGGRGDFGFGLRKPRR
ncbi:unnamed protein product, partial [Ectocarpus sp. 12 AP-2014]